MVQNLPPACFRFLQSLLVDWNGEEGRNIILDLLTYLPIRPFDGELPTNIVSEKKKNIKVSRTLPVDVSVSGGCDYRQHTGGTSCTSLTSKFLQCSPPPMDRVS